MLSVVQTMSKCCGDILTGNPQNIANVGKDLNVDANNTTIHDSSGLTPDDVVLLYQNYDADPHAVSTTSDILWRASNQYVETVMHQEHDPAHDYLASDISSPCSLGNINDIFLINNERLNLLNNPSFEMSLDHRYGCLDFEHFNLSAEYEPHYLRKDSYKHFRVLNNMTMELESYELPKSLLDYIHCKRLEDNFNFDMNNIIIYVKNTIEQLRRISNGEYLSEKAREKWFEVDNYDENVNYIDVNLDFNKVLANAVSIPVYAERKTTNRSMTWDDIVHSEMDLKSLSKLLEKQIILHIPKLIDCPYTLFSKSWNDGLVLRCMKVSKDGKRRTCPRVDVFLQLQRSDSGQLLNNINSVMILKKSHLLNIKDTSDLNIISKCDDVEDKTLDSFEILIVLNIKEVDNDNSINPELSLNRVTNDIMYKKNINIKTSEEKNQSKQNNNSQPSITCFNEFATIDSSTDLMLSMKQLNMECTVPEETEEQIKTLKETVKLNKRKSPTLKTRIKSPYENKSIAVDEKKRRRLLEIRERREKRKLIISENCKMKKNKYGKSFVQAQASSSVTKLSITNKAFYKSIFGESLGTINSNKISTECNNKEIKISKTAPYKYSDLENNTIGSILLNNNNECDSSISLSSSEHIPTFTITDDYKTEDLTGIFNVNRQLLNNNDDILEDKKVPSNSPKSIINKASSSSSTSLELKESINKIYDIISPKHHNKVNGGKMFKETNDYYPVNINENDSGTSLKYELTSSIPSSHSFDNIYMDKCSVKVTENIPKVNNFREHMIPKVFVSAKLQSRKQEIPKNEILNDRKNNTTVKSKTPLNTISRILDQIEDVQKNKLKENFRTGNKNTIPINVKQNINKNQSNKYTVEATTVSNRNKRKSSNYLEKTNKVPSVLLTSQFDNINVKHIDKTQHYKISSIIEEAKEARGEAVRGPPRNISRIDYLAQPRKFIDAANSEEFHRKYGRNFNRIQRLSPLQPVKDKTICTTGNKVLKNNITSDFKLIEKPLDNKDTTPISYHPKLYNSKEFGKKSVTFAKTKKNDQVKTNHGISVNTSRISNKRNSKEGQTLDKNNPEKRFIPTNFGFIEPSLPKNEALYGLQLHKMVNKILNKTELHDLPEDTESNASETLNIQNNVNNAPIKNQVNKESNLKLNIIETFQDNSKNSITVTLPTTIIDESSVYSYSPTPSKIQVKQSQLHSGHDGSLVSNSNSLVKIRSNLLKNVSNNILYDLNISSSEINSNWPFKPFQISTVGYAISNFTTIKPIKKTFLKSTFSSTTNAILMVDKPTQVTETTKMEIALQANFGNMSFDRVFLNKSVQSEVTLTPNTCNITYNNKAAIEVTDLYNQPDNTSSLDLLVTLLNEIQSITTCQSELMKANIEPFGLHSNIEIDQADKLNDQEDITCNYYELKDIESNTVNDNNSVNYCYNESEPNSLVGTATNLVDKTTKHNQIINETQDLLLKQPFDDLGVRHIFDSEIMNIYGNNIENNKMKFESNFQKTSIINNEDKYGKESAPGDQSHIKIKRDVLVTMYSVLIFTVFAALSLPDILNF